MTGVLERGKFLEWFVLPYEAASNGDGTVNGRPGLELEILDWVLGFVKGMEMGGKQRVVFHTGNLSTFRYAMRAKFRFCASLRRQA